MTRLATAHQRLTRPWPTPHEQCGPAAAWGGRQVRLSKSSQRRAEGCRPCGAVHAPASILARDGRTSRSRIRPSAGSKTGGKKETPARISGPGNAGAPSLFLPPQQGRQATPPYPPDICAVCASSPNLVPATFSFLDRPVGTGQHPLGRGCVRDLRAAAIRATLPPIAPADPRQMVMRLQ